MVGGLVRMRADRAPDVGIAVGDRPHSIELVEPGVDRQQRCDAGGAGAGNDRGALVGEIGEIEVTVAVDQHRQRWVIYLPVAGLVPAEGFLLV